MPSKTILIVDDEPDTVTYFAELLEDNGYTTVTAENGEDALAKVAACAPDLITLDVTMPEMSGIKFYKTIRESQAHRNIPIVIITGVSHDFEGYISSRRQVPAPDGYLSKPVDRDKLLHVVESIIGTPAGR